jgi:hypothetical protein
MLRESGILKRSSMPISTISSTQGDGQWVLRAGKGVGVLIAIHLLFVPSVERTVPRDVGSIALVLLLTYGISLAFAPKIRFVRRFGISYLILTGFFYLMAGIGGQLRSWGLLETMIWRSLISPYPLMTLIAYGVPRSAHDFKWAQIEVVPPAGDALFSFVVIFISASAIVAAIAMVWNKVAAYRFWLVILLASFACTAGYLVLSMVGEGLKFLALPVLLVASYVAAYLMAGGRFEWNGSGVGCQPIK